MAKTPNIKLNSAIYKACCNYQLQKRGEANCVARSLSLRARHEQMVCRARVGLVLSLSRDCIDPQTCHSSCCLASESQILASFKLSRRAAALITTLRVITLFVNAHSQWANVIVFRKWSMRPIEAYLLIKAFRSSNELSLLAYSFKSSRSDWTLKVISVNELELERKPANVLNSREIPHHLMQNLLWACSTAFSNMMKGFWAGSRNYIPALWLSNIEHTHATLIFWFKITSAIKG